MSTPLPEGLRIVDATREEHFRAMSLIHALGWRDTYRNALPADYMEAEITDDCWVAPFRENYLSGNSCKGILLYKDATPVSCLNYCLARTVNFNSDICQFNNAGYEDWGEIASFYTHPAERSKGYGGILFEEALARMKAKGFQNVFVFVLRENEKARRFYAAHGFHWDGTANDILFPHDTVCVDLRYVKAL